MLKKLIVRIFILGVITSLFLVRNEISIVMAEEVKDIGGSGVVQFWQEIVPGQENLESWTGSKLTFNSQKSSLYCKGTHTLSTSGGKSSHNTYISSCNADDALYLGEDNDYYYIYLSGYEGKVLKSNTVSVNADLNQDGKNVTYKVNMIARFIPFSDAKLASEEDLIDDVNLLEYATQSLEKDYNMNLGIQERAVQTAQSPSYYANENGTLIHYLTNDVTKLRKTDGTSIYSKSIVGKAPDWMKVGIKYYSYDGVFFYENIRNIMIDGTGSTNQNNPFYNYYQYLPFRTTTNYTADVMDAYTNNSSTGHSGVMVNSGESFYSVQDLFGINGLLQYAMGIHESGFGTSTISKNKNNLFGVGANDGNPYGDANSYPSIQNGIYSHADYYVSRAYTNPSDKSGRYYGSHIGNKGSGMNVMYASDPYWGEKIAGWYYRIDLANGLKDYNYYSIGIKSDSTVANIRIGASTSNPIVYKTLNITKSQKISNYPVIIIGEDGNYYRIKSDIALVGGQTENTAQYVWSNTDVYIVKDVINIINNKGYNRPGNQKLTGWQDINGEWYYYDENHNKLIGWQDIGGNGYYFDEDGKMLKGFQEINSIWYYFNNQGHLQKGWQDINGKWYYFNWDAHMVKGWQDIDGNGYYFDEDGKMLKGFQEINSIWYYFNNQGHLQKGWRDIDGNGYYFNEEGHMLKGFQEINSIQYYFDNQGHLKKGWQDINGKRYYFDERAHMIKDTTHLIDGNWYYFNELGHLQIQSAWHEINSTWYYFDWNGNKVTSWQDIDGNGYYFDEDGQMLKGFQNVNDIWYYFNEYGHLKKGWQEIEGFWYYFNADAHMLTGWQDIDGNRYYFEVNGRMLKNTTHLIDGNWYVFNELGHLQ